MPDASAIGTVQAAAVGLATGLAIGMLLGHWLAGRKQQHRRHAAGHQHRDGAAHQRQPSAVVANDAGDQSVDRSGAPIVAATAPDPITGSLHDEAADAANREPLPAEVQALIDKGDVFPALSQLRKLSGGMAARRLAREQLAGGRVPLPSDIRRLADGGNKIGAIQALCEQTHMDLTLARELVERHAAAPR